MVRVKAGKPLSDFFSQTLPSEVRDALEKKVRTQLPTAEVKLLGSRWVTANDVQWREVALKQRYGSTVSAGPKVAPWTPGTSPGEANYSWASRWRTAAS